jgi:hypothetical protein
MVKQYLKEGIILFILILFSAYFTSAVDLPNLVIQNVSITPSDFEFGDPVTFNFTVKNIGTAYAGPDIRANITADGTEIFMGNVPQLVPGASHSLSFTWNDLNSICNANIVIKADPQNWYNESNEIDNRWSTTLVCQLERSDLIISRVYYLPDVVWEGAESRWVFYMKNIGNSMSYGDTRVGVKVDNVLVHEDTSHSLQPDEEMSFGWDWTVRCGARIEIIADPSNWEPELNENNNNWILPDVYCSGNPQQGTIHLKEYHKQVSKVKLPYPPDPSPITILTSEMKSELSIIAKMMTKNARKREYTTAWKSFLTKYLNLDMNTALRHLMREVKVLRGKSFDKNIAGKEKRYLRKVGEEIRKQK